MPAPSRSRGSDPRSGPAAGEPILVGDIGGTRARIGIYTSEAGALRALDRRSYGSHEFDGVVSLVRTYLAESDRTAPRHGCLALAAPRQGGCWSFPNLGWKVEPEPVRGALEMPSLRFVNDFDAVAHAIDHLGEDDRVALQAGPVDPRAPRAILGAGTGLGTAFTFWCAGRHHVVSSEGGHVDFAPPTARETGLLEFLRAHRDDHHVSFERVLSGDGLASIYRYVARTGAAPEDADTVRRLAEEDPAAVVAELGMAGADPLCAQALDVFAEVYGALAGSLALLVQARGGVYVAGGIAPRILPKLRDGTFARAYRRKGRVSGMLEDCPVFVVTREDVGLLGAAAAVLEPTGG